MPFEAFDKRLTPLAKAPIVTIQKRGIMSLNSRTVGGVGRRPDPRVRDPRRLVSDCRPFGVTVSPYPGAGGAGRVPAGSHRDVVTTARSG